MQLELTDRERELLAELIESRIGELHTEIRRAMDYKFKDQLKDQMEAYRKLLARLQ